MYLCIYVSMYLRIYVSMCLCMDVWMYGCMGVWLCMDMYGYVWICMDMYGYVWICMDMYGYVWICMDMYGYVWICMDVWMYVCMHVCMWTVSMYAWMYVCMYGILPPKKQSLFQTIIFGEQLHKNCAFHFFKFYWNCVMHALSSHPSGIPGFTVQGDMGWRGICHVWTWLSSANDPWYSCCLHKSVLGLKDPQSRSKTMAENCVEMAETSGKMAEISGNVLLVIFACNKGQKDCESLNWSPEYHLMHVVRSIKIGCPSKTLKNDF